VQLFARASIRALHRSVARWGYGTSGPAGDADNGEAAVGAAVNDHRPTGLSDMAAYLGLQLPDLDLVEEEDEDQGEEEDHRREGRGKEGASERHIHAREPRPSPGPGPGPGPGQSLHRLLRAELDRTGTGDWGWESLVCAGGAQALGWGRPGAEWADCAGDWIAVVSKARAREWERQRQREQGVLL